MLTVTATIALTRCLCKCHHFFFLFFLLLLHGLNTRYVINSIVKNRKCRTLQVLHMLRCTL